MSPANSQPSRARERKALEDDPLWYQDAILYEVHVRAFRDSDGNGVGDFRGLVEKLDYIQQLGVTAIWLLPFYPSPLRDDGYDIADYGDVHPTYGTVADFKLLLREAHRRGLRVITELVINHTSDRHPWFIRARNAPPGSVERDFYVWSDNPEKYAEARIIFRDFETSNWTLDPVANAFYWHRFYSHQPDLNFRSPHVRKAVFEVLDFWLDMGVDGLRLDAVPYLYEREGTSCENLPETHEFLKEMRAHVDRRYRNRMLLAEANQWPEDSVAYFGAGDECHMAFHFPMMPRMFMALHMEDRFPLVDILAQTPAIPASAQWALFLRNHDELTLEMVTDEERDYMYSVYASDPKARINLGIRRRLAPLLGNHRRKIELMYALLLSLPGTPVIYYGDEIGMGDNIYLGDRDSVRTPMQWSDQRNAGFSDANPQALYLPVVIDPEYHYGVVNVDVQARNQHSLLWWVRRIIALRRRYRAFGRGTLEMLTPSNRKVLAFVRRLEHERILVVANLSRYAQYVELDLSNHVGLLPIEMFGRTRFPAVGDAPYPISLGPHSFLWLTLEPRHAETLRPPRAVLPRLAAEDAWTDATDPRLDEIIRGFLRSRPWQSTGREIKTVKRVDSALLNGGGMQCVLVVDRVEYVEAEAELCVIPLAMAQGPSAEAVRQHVPEALVAQVATARSGDEGVLYDALDSGVLLDLLLSVMARRRSWKTGLGEVAAIPSRRFSRSEESGTDLRLVDLPRTSVVTRRGYVMKLFRVPLPGVHPEPEALTFLSDVHRFAHVPDLLGHVEYRPQKGEPLTLIVLQRYVPHEGTAWKVARDEAARFLEGMRSAPREMPPLPPLQVRTLLDEATSPDASTEGYVRSHLQQMRLLGKRVGELHAALGDARGNSAFHPEPFTPLDRRAVSHGLRSEAQLAFEALRGALPTLAEHARGDAETVLAAAPSIESRFRAMVSAASEAVRIRCHGNLNLGQVLDTGKDFVFVGFEGDTRLPLGVRRLRRSPLRDVASLLYSCHHASMAALRRLVEGGAVSPIEREHYERWRRAWATWSAAAVLGGYLEQTRGARFLPDEPETLAIFLEAFLIEKGIRELADRLVDEPGRVGIALRWLAGMAAQ